MKYLLILFFVIFLFVLSGKKTTIKNISVPTEYEREHFPYEYIHDYYAFVPSISVKNNSYYDYENKLNSLYKDTDRASVTNVPYSFNSSVSGYCVQQHMRKYQDLRSSTEQCLLPHSISTK